MDRAKVLSEAVLSVCVFVCVHPIFYVDISSMLGEVADLLQYDTLRVTLIPLYDSDHGDTRILAVVPRLVSVLLCI